MAADREPWIKVKIGARRSGKIAGLPSDSARLGYFYLLLEAKVQRRMGVFDNRAHFLEVLGRFGRYLDDYVTAELVHEAPAMCPDCRARNAGVSRGQLVVHDYAKEQRDPTHADRQADYRGKKRDGDGDGDASGTASTVTHPVTHEAESDGVRDGSGTPDSRARGTTGTGTTTETSDSSTRSLGRESQHRATDSNKNGASGPTLTKAQLEAWRSFGSEWDDVKAAWLDRGLHWPPSGEADDERSQRALLYEILDARPTDLVRWIRDAPAKAPSDQVVGHVLAKWRAVKAEVEADEPVPWLQERRGPMEPVGAVVERVVRGG